MYTIASLAPNSVEATSNAPGIQTLPTAAWDVVSFFENAGEFVKTAGAGLLVAMGLIALVWGGVLLLKKLMSGQQNNDSWIKIILLMIVGGAISVGGFALIFTIGSGGKTTIEDLGGATFLWGGAQLLGLG
jgi:hypothetical protein